MERKAQLYAKENTGSIMRYLNRKMNSMLCASCKFEIYLRRKIYAVSIYASILPRIAGGHLTAINFAESDPEPKTQADLRS